MKVYAGLDGGSTYLKAALLDEQKRVIRTGVTSTGIDNNSAAKKLLTKLMHESNVNRIAYTMATGYSRKILEIADDDVSEITAHAYGVRVTAPKEYHPGMIVDIGGQDSKIIYLDTNYSVKNFSMNDKCAAGTGKFMEVIAQILETTIDQVGPLSLESNAPCDINSTCVVFAQSEVISLIARKFDRRDILSGMHLSMAKRIIKMMKKSEKNGDVLMTGGGALNIGLRKAFEDELMRDIFVANYPQFNGARDLKSFYRTDLPRLNAFLSSGGTLTNAQQALVDETLAMTERTANDEEKDKALLTRFSEMTRTLDAGV